MSRCRSNRPVKNWTKLLSVFDAQTSPFDKELISSSKRTDRVHFLNDILEKLAIWLLTTLDAFTPDVERFAQEGIYQFFLQTHIRVSHCHTHEQDNNQSKVQKR